ncbi:hypothetical protein EDC94DRAFT_597554 [Helicostylum pulchrum]|nr:hypothetical protein EDC94DRAFT_597554 [Helicostylum pulchrum]
MITLQNLKLGLLIVVTSSLSLDKQQLKLGKALLESTTCIDQIFTACYIDYLALLDLIFPISSPTAIVSKIK